MSPHEQLINLSEAETSHTPVLLAEVLAALDPKPGSQFIDATAGGGGHSEALLMASAPDGRVLSIDADPAAIARVRARLQPFAQRSVVVQANFRQLHAVAHKHGFVLIDGIIFDLGFSSDQLADGKRGFSWQRDGPLDMRFDPTQPVTAADLVNDLSEQELAKLIATYGEERFAKRIAKAIVAARPLYTTGELAAVIESTVGRRGRLHPATRTFQALRIAVNNELEALKDVLPQAVQLLRPGGRLAVISFHSLEDRIVKQFMQREARDCICPPEVPVCRCHHKASLRLIARKPVRPLPTEIAHNPRSRSARLRIAERLPASVALPTEKGRRSDDRTNSPA